jgi:hypothetical protein
MRGVGERRQPRGQKPSGSSQMVRIGLPSTFMKPS